MKIETVWHDAQKVMSGWSWWELKPDVCAQCHPLAFQERQLNFQAGIQGTFILGAPGHEQ